MAWFKSSGEKNVTIEACERMIKAFYRKVGMNADACRIEDPNALAWVFTRGSAPVQIRLLDKENMALFQIVSPILYLPEENVLAFYRRCLDLNRSLINCALCTQGDQVALIVQRPIEGLDENELEGMLAYLSGVADELDNQLAEQFGARMIGNDPE